MTANDKIKRDIIKAMVGGLIFLAAAFGWGLLTGPNLCADGFQPLKILLFGIIFVFLALVSLSFFLIAQHLAEIEVSECDDAD